MFKAVSEGNDHADWLADLISVACEHDLLYWVENPDGSFLWLLDAWIELGSQTQRIFFVWTIAGATALGGRGLVF